MPSSSFHDETPSWLSKLILGRPGIELEQRRITSLETYDQIRVSGYTAAQHSMDEVYASLGRGPFVMNSSIANLYELPEIMPLIEAHLKSRTPNPPMFKALKHPLIYRRLGGL